MGAAAERSEAAAAARPAAPLRARRQYGTVAALAAAVLFLGVAEGFALVALPLGVLLVALAPRRRWRWVGCLVVALAVSLSAGTGFGALSAGWGLVLGGTFAAATLTVPRWSPFSRALVAVGGAAVAVGAALALTGAWRTVEWAVSDHFRALAALTSREFLARFPDAGWSASLPEMTQRMAEAQGTLFPALLALQSLAALALTWWAFHRSRSRARRPALRPLREFRFPDALVWVLIAGLLLVLLPLGEGAARLGYNLMMFMGALYMLRGLAVFVFLARGTSTLTSVVVGGIAALFFHQFLVTAALLVGLGDTWLDVRGRVVAGARP